MAIESGYERGQHNERINELEMATVAAIRSMFAGRALQNQSPPVLEENRVRKSETETFK